MQHVQDDTMHLPCQEVPTIKHVACELVSSQLCFSCAAIGLCCRAMHFAYL